MFFVVVWHVFAYQGLSQLATSVLASTNHQHWPAWCARFSIFLTTNRIELLLHCNQLRATRFVAVRTAAGAASGGGSQESQLLMNGARRGAAGGGAFGTFCPPPPPGSQVTPSHFFNTHISMANSAASSMASSPSLSSPTASRTGEGNGSVFHGLVSGSRSLLGVGVRRAATARHLRRHLRLSPVAPRRAADECYRR